MGKSAVFLITIVLFLVGCTAVPNPTSTPVIPLAQATLVIERPSVTPLPTLTMINTVTETAVLTPIPSSTTPGQTPTATPLPLTETPTPTTTPDPNATPRPGFSPPILSSQGQLAFVQDEVLYVETAVGSGTFLEVDRYVSVEPVWSPDGEKLIYSTSQYPSGAYEWSYPQNQYLWLATNNTIFSLSENVPGFPPLSDLINIGWSPDSTKIVFETSTPEIAGSTQYFMADLHENSFLQLIDRVNKGRLSHMTNEVVVVFSHCGAPCQEIMVVNYQGQQLWQPEWRIGGFVSYAPDNQSFINIGRFSISNSGGIPDATVDKIDLQTGSLNIVWQTSRQNGYFALEQPTISPNGRFVTFNFMPSGVEWDVLGTLYLIDLNGRIYHECETCLVLDWQPEGGPVAVQFLPSGENQLVYLPLDGSLPRVFVTPKPFVFASGKWSENGRYFVYSAFDETTSASYLYLWQPDSGEPTLIHATASDEPLSSFAWMPDSSGFYFNAAGVYTELWWYGVETAEIRQIQ